MRLWTVESGFESLGGNSKNNKARQSVVIDGLLFLLEVIKGYNCDSSLSAISLHQYDLSTIRSVYHEKHPLKQVLK